MADASRRPHVEVASEAAEADVPARPAESEVPAQPAEWEGPGARAARLLPARIAGQSGLVTAVQAIEAGQTLEHLRWMVRSGRWTRLHRGVYLTTPGRDDWEMHAVAALLAVGAPCALTGSSAGRAWGLSADTGWQLPDSKGGKQRRFISVVVPWSRRGLTRPGISVTRSRGFAVQTHPQAWPHRLTAEHTVLELGRMQGAERTVGLMAKACQQQLATEMSLAAALEQRPRQPHRTLAREALGLVGAGAESAAEIRFIRDVEAAHGLPLGVRQEPAPGARHRDTSYDEFAVIVEIDGRLGHVGWLGQKRDNRRDRKAATTGRLTIRGGWTDVAVTPCEFALDLAEIFSLRGWPGRAKACTQPGCLLQTLAA